MASCASVGVAPTAPQTENDHPPVAPLWSKPSPSLRAPQPTRDFLRIGKVQSDNPAITGRPPSTFLAGNYAWQGATRLKVGFFEGHSCCGRSRRPRGGVAHSSRWPTLRPGVNGHAQGRVRGRRAKASPERRIALYQGGRMIRQSSQELRMFRARLGSALDAPQQAHSQQAALPFWPCLPRAEPDRRPSPSLLWRGGDGAGVSGELRARVIDIAGSGAASPSRCVTGRRHDRRPTRRARPRWRW